MDNHEMEKIIEDALQSAMPEEGQEQLNDNEKNMVSLKTKYQALSRTFYAPELAASKKRDSDGKDGVKSGDGDRSQKGSATSQHEEGYNYIPLAPEQWQDKILELKSIYVLKYPKIVQVLFYFLQY
jgi:hypothetical protein